MGEPPHRQPIPPHACVCLECSKLEQWDIIIKSDSAYQMLDQKYKALKAKRGKIRCVLACPRIGFWLAIIWCHSLRAAPVDPRTTTKYPIEDTEVDGSYKIGTPLPCF